MIIAKLALVTCVIYMLIPILLEACLLVLTHVKGSIFHAISYRVWAISFALLWLVSFSAPGWVVIVPLRARFR